MGEHSKALADGEEPCSLHGQLQPAVLLWLPAALYPFLWEPGSPRQVC